MESTRHETHEDLTELAAEAAAAVVAALRSRVAFTLEPRLRYWFTGGDERDERFWLQRIRASAASLADGPAGAEATEREIWRAWFLVRLSLLATINVDAGVTELRSLVADMTGPPVPIPPDDSSAVARGGSSDHGRPPGHTPPGPPLDDTTWDDE